MLKRACCFVAVVLSFVGGVFKKMMGVFYLQLLFLATDGRSKYQGNMDNTWLFNADTLVFVLNSVLIGCALSLDSFSLCVANALVEPAMPRKKKIMIGTMHSVLQALMPMVGWGLVNVAALFLKTLMQITPYISLVLLSFIGGRMVWEALFLQKENAKVADNSLPCKKDEDATLLTPAVLLLQGISASIDALSVGFSIATYSPLRVFGCGLLIAGTTSLFCVAAFKIGRVLSSKFERQSQIIGGLILVSIGIEIFITR